jgi:hypothetical protein
LNGHSIKLATQQQVSEFTGGPPLFLANWLSVQTD